MTGVAWVVVLRDGRGEASGVLAKLGKFHQGANARSLLESARGADVMLRLQCMSWRLGRMAACTFHHVLRAPGTPGYLHQRSGEQPVYLYLLEP